MANYLLQEAKKYTWKSLIPLGIMLSFCGGIFSIIGIVLLALGVRDLLHHINLNLFFKRAIFFSLLIGLPYLIVANLLIVFQVAIFGFLILYILSLFIVKIHRI